MADLQRGPCARWRGPRGQDWGGIRDHLGRCGGRSLLQGAHRSGRTFERRDTSYYVSSAPPTMCQRVSARAHGQGFAARFAAFPSPTVDGKTWRVWPSWVVGDVLQHEVSQSLRPLLVLQIRESTDAETVPGGRLLSKLATRRELSSIVKQMESQPGAFPEVGRSEVKHAVGHSNGLVPGEEPQDLRSRNISVGCLSGP
ncbi:hypothetical protein L226DRAFT_43767 [Lentinus tigrinus ALCF2SS1-7]|uniref:uncharacterized protein n=1 Tax=Lentinus tigrinus ALCF2SS1-7 TaxID=1328758 RepID=UPI0011660B25|nr:hypothetical protein L226DRAFT_43767 [Lentinus tigrinus ALCF2SS1-7]